MLICDAVVACFTENSSLYWSDPTTCGALDQTFTVQVGLFKKKKIITMPQNFGTEMILGLQLMYKPRQILQPNILPSTILLFRLN